MREGQTFGGLARRAACLLRAVSLKRREAEAYARPVSEEQLASGAKAAAEASGASHRKVCETYAEFFRRASSEGIVVRVETEYDSFEGIPHDTIYDRTFVRNVLSGTRRNEIYFSKITSLTIQPTSDDEPAFSTP